VASVIDGWFILPIEPFSDYSVPLILGTRQIPYNGYQSGIPVITAGIIELKKITK